MLIKIQRNQIHHYIEPVLDAEGNPTGEEKDVLQFDLQFPEFPVLPTYGMRVDLPVTKEEVRAELVILAQRAIAQMNRDEVVRARVEAMGFLEFDLPIP